MTIQRDFRHVGYVYYWILVALDSTGFVLAWAMGATEHLAEKRLLEAL